MRWSGVSATENGKQFVHGQFLEGFELVQVVADLFGRGLGVLEEEGARTKGLGEQGVWKRFSSGNAWAVHGIGLAILEFARVFHWMV